MDDWSRAELMFHLRYSLRFGERQARLYSRADFAIKLIALASGLSAVTAVIAERPIAVAIVGGIVGIVTIVDALWRPTELAFRTKAARARYEQLAAEASKLTDQELRIELEKIDASDAPEVEGLRPVVFNDVVAENSTSDPPTDKLMPVSAWSRVVAVLT